MKSISELAWHIRSYLNGSTRDLEEPRWVKVLPKHHRLVFLSDLNEALEKARNTEVWDSVEDVLWRWRGAAQLFLDPGLAKRLGLSLDESKRKRSCVETTRDTREKLKN